MCSWPLPVRPALPLRHAPFAAAALAVRAVAKASATQAMVTRAVLLHRSRAVPLQVAMKHGEPATHWGARVASRNAVKARRERDRPGRGAQRGGRTRG